MNTRVTSLRMLAALSAAACVLLASSTALAQTAPDSDLFQESVTISSLPTTPNVIPPTSIHIPENPPEATFTITVPTLNILFVENSGTGTTSSDYFHINQFNVVIQSDNEVGLPPRTAVPAQQIPASANEAFLPLSIFAGSDGNQATAGTESDHVTIFTGFFGQANPTPVFQQIIGEVVADPATEPGIAFSVGPLFFDLVEPTTDPGQGPISDYVDLPNGVSGTFTSSDDPAAFQGLPVDATVVEDPLNGAEIHYSLGFVSDVVPEPGSLVLLSLGGLALVAHGWRRRRAG